MKIWRNGVGKNNIFYYGFKQVFLQHSSGIVVVLKDTETKIDDSWWVLYENLFESIFFPYTISSYFHRFIAHRLHRFYIKRQVNHWM